MSSNWGSSSRDSSGSSSRSDVDNSFDADELLQIGSRCMEVNLFFFLYILCLRDWWSSYFWLYDLMFSL